VNPAAFARDVLASLRLLRHGAAVRAAHRAEEERAQGAGGPLRAAGRAAAHFWGVAPLTALAALGWERVEDFRHLQVHFGISVVTFALHLLVLAWVCPRRIGEIRSHESLLFPGRATLVVARWLEAAPRLLLASAVFGFYRFAVVQGIPSPFWVVTPILAFVAFPWLAAVVVAVPRLLERDTPGVLLAQGILRMILGLFPITAAVVLLAASFRAELDMFLVLTHLILAGWGAVLVVLGLRTLRVGFRAGREAGFELRATLSLGMGSAVVAGVGLTGVAALGLIDHGGNPEHAAYGVARWGFAVLGAAFLVFLESLRHASRKDLPACTRADRLPTAPGMEEERRIVFPEALLAGRPPRGFAAARAFRRKVATPFAFRWVLGGFALFCLLAANLTEYATWLGAVGLLGGSTSVGFGVMPRLRQYGVDLRDQHLDNLRELGLRVLLPALAAAALLGLGAPREARTKELLLVLLATVLLRAGVVGYWRLAWAGGLRVGYAAFLAAFALLPVGAVLLGIEWFDGDFTRQVIAIYGCAGLLGLGIHLATLQEDRLVEEFRRAAEPRRWWWAWKEGAP
jgi:hypothetical protein